MDPLLAGCGGCEDRPESSLSRLTLHNRKPTAHIVRRNSPSSTLKRHTPTRWLGVKWPYTRSWVGGNRRHKTVIKSRGLSDNICAASGRTNAFFLKRKERVFIYDLRGRRLANGFEKKRIRYRL